MLHSIAAQHKDQSSKKQFPGLQINQLGYNCDCNDIVATSPYTEATAEPVVRSLAPVSIYSETAPDFVLHTTDFYFSLRGPPANALAGIKMI